MATTMVDRRERGTERLLFDLAAVERLTADAPGGLELDEELEDALEALVPTREVPTAETTRAVLAQPMLRRVPAPPPEDAPITCLVADDHPIVSESIAQVLGRHGFEVVARAKDGEEALEAIRLHKPHVALVDLRLPVLDGGEVAGRASKEAPDTAVVLYTGADPLLLSGALESGARGFLLKEAPVADLARAVRMVAQGHVYLDPALAGFLMGSPARHDLNRHELEILRLLAEGCTNETIGKKLHLSPETVRNHVRKLMGKLDAQTRTEAVATALREQLIA
jgi:DNA-binding NarL/FixJ family response regulator